MKTLYQLAMIPLLCVMSSCEEPTKSPQSFRSSPNRQVTSQAQPMFSDEQKQMGLMILGLIAEAALNNQQPTSNTSPHSGYQSSYRQWSPGNSGGSSGGQQYRQRPQYNLSTTVPGGSVEAQTFVNEFTRIVPNSTSTDALKLYDSVKKAR